MGVRWYDDDDVYLHTQDATEQALYIFTCVHHHQTPRSTSPLPQRRVDGATVASISSTSMPLPSLIAAPPAVACPTSSSEPSTVLEWQSEW